MTTPNVLALPPIQAAVAAYRAGDYHSCCEHYREAIRRYPQLTASIEFTLEVIQKRHQQTSSEIAVADHPSRERDPNMGYVLRSLGIEHIYIVNLDRRPDRMIRVLREMNFHGVNVSRISAVDAQNSLHVKALVEEFRTRDPRISRPSSAHIPTEVRKEYKSWLTPGVFGYLLSQAAVLEDALRKGYRHILVFDDDVFFTSDAAPRLDSVGHFLPEDWKILLLGASEYADRSSLKFTQAQAPGTSNLYHPIPGLTCGSFAVAYNCSVYEELLQAIGEADGPYDNVALGSLYLKYAKNCFVIQPAVCVPDVSESDIRNKARAQEEHSQKMQWEFARYPTFTAPMNMAILVNDLTTLRYVEQLRHRLPGGIFLNVFYHSTDGLRPIIVGRHFRPADTQALPILCADGAALREAAAMFRVPYADILMLWPSHRSLDDNAAQTVYVRALELANKGLGAEGTVDGVVYCLNAGVRPIRGMHSIVIPCFRGVDHAWPSILSALQQDAESFEVIVVNDNPAQNSFRADLMLRVKELATQLRADAISRLQIIEHEINRNAAAARNTGFLRASGEYLSFLDDDDYFEPNRLTAIEGALASGALNVGAAYCGYSGAWNGQPDTSRFIDGNLELQVLALRYGEHYMCTNTVTFRRESFVTLGGFNESYRRHQDLELMTRFFAEYEIRAVPSFCVRNRPSPVPETFTADISRLCQLKHQFLRDFRKEICTIGSTYFEEILQAHLRDICKRDRNMPAATINIIETFLRSALSS